MNSNIIKQAKIMMRKQILAKIKSLTYEDKLRQSIFLQKKILSDEKWIKSKRVSLYLSTEDEVSTLELLRAGLESEKSMFIPKYSKSSMEMVEITSMEDYDSLPSNSWNIKQPLIRDKSRQVINPNNGGLDLIVMPGVAFTRGGERLGHGGGYYDTYLNAYKILFNTFPFLIAPAFIPQLTPYIPCTEFDVNVDVVLFDEREN